MVKIYSTALLVAFSMLLAAPEVRGDEPTSASNPTFRLNKRGQQLLLRTFRSQEPTHPPTIKPTEPSAAPTESPAPSPSPSANPTKNPDRITLPPSESPTESPAPSPSPSAAPTNAPTSSPSASPSSAPTVSAAPSASPTESPSDSPSKSPTTSPSASPTVSAAPSNGPTDTFAPSVSPTDYPSASPSYSPSDAPSMSPTSVTDRTKTAVATLLLEEITEEMDRMVLAEFELFTMDFLRRKIPDKNLTYELNTIATTVLSQKNIINPDLANLTSTPEIEQPPSRKLETEIWTVGLEVDIRTVSVVTEGRVPNDFNLTEIVLLTFYNNWDQYLWQLGNSIQFFNPLIDVSDWTPLLIEESVEKKKGKGTFVISIMFSFVAFLIAVFASYVAIRKHMDKKRKNGRTPSKNKLARGTLFSPKHSPKHYDVINYLTQTMSEDKNSPNGSYHDGDVEGGGALGLLRNVNIDIDENGMESVVLTPRANFQSPNASVRNGLFVVDEVSDDDQSPLKSPEATSPMVDPASASRIGGQIKKWLTPRGLKSASSNRRLSSDPPEHQSTLGYNYGKDNIEPVAIKASTKNQTGVYTTDKSTIDGRSRATGISYNKRSSDDGQFTLPISFFSNRGPGTNVSGVDSPMSSLADSNASSFFAIGNMNKSFTGQRNAAGSMEDEGYEVTAPKTTQENPSANNDEPVFEDEPKENEPTEPEPIQKAPASVPRMPSPSESSAKASAVKLAAQRFEKPQLKPLRQIQPPSSTVGVETILGARSRDSADEEDKRSNVSSSFLKNRSIFSPDKSTKDFQPKKRPPSTRYGRVNIEVQEQDARSVTSHSTLGARPMTRKEDDTDDRSTVSAFSTLSSIMRRPGSYDVYAPSGPIGIVVDTSKDGPSVHSLKSTSPMLGLISPGDLIVALDGEDTRKMTAAALTRLMARKSRQKERKITLLS